MNTRTARQIEFCFRGLLLRSTGSLIVTDRFFDAVHEHLAAILGQEADEIYQELADQALGKAE